MRSSLLNIGGGVLLVLVLGGIGYTFGLQMNGVLEDKREALGLSFEYREALPVLVTWQQDERVLTLHSNFVEGEVCMDQEYGPVVVSTFTFYEPAHCISIADLREAFSKHQEWLVPSETLTILEDGDSILIEGGVQ